jgi:NSS family neurotransmitter:Na+ symporter
MERTRWRSNMGFLLAAIGSAIGLGNIWRFSYMTYENGGGAFLIPYFVALLTAGIPLMILEYGFGHKIHGSSNLCFARIDRKWEWLGWWMPVFAMFGIMLYYAVVIGWCINYTIFSLTLKWGSDAQGFFLNQFLGLSSDVWQIGGFKVSILISTFLVWGICWYICYKDIDRGIEKACKIFMPTLLVLTAILVFWSLTLEGAGSGIAWYLKPNWKKLMNWDVWIAAYGQIFFTLSLAFGIMIAYASYLPKDTDIIQNAFITSFADCFYSVFAGFAVFGVLGYMAHTKGVGIDQVIKSGPSLAFVAYPEAISNLPFLRNLFGVLFFLALLLAGLSSGISLIEAFACSVTDKFNFKRERVVTATCILGFLGSLIFTTRAGLYWLDIADHFLTSYGLILAGILECIAVGWFLKASVLRSHINAISGWQINKIWDYAIKIFTPGILLIIFITNLMGEVKTPYEGYKVSALLILGLGWLVVTLVVSIILTLRPWGEGKLAHEHLPEEDKLMI